MERNLYRKREATSQEIVDRVRVGYPDEVARVILAVSPCRSGSTALLKVFGAVGIESHYQQLKNVLRWRLQGGEVTWRVPSSRNGPIFLKETLGPYTAAESSLNPLDVLLRAGYPAEKLHVVIIGRAPLSMWASWHEWWGRRTGLDRLILAFETTDAVARQAREAQVATTTYVYEALRDNGPDVVMKRLFARLALPFAPAAVRGWRPLEALDAPGSNIVMPDEPPIFMRFVPGIHQPIRQARRLRFVSRETSVARLPEDDVQAIAEAGLPERYRRWRLACEEDLGISIGADRDWELVE